MASIPQRPEGRVLPTLDVFIQVLSIAKDTCGIPPAQVAFGSAGVLLAVIRVCLPPPLNADGILTRVPLGHNGKRSGLL